MKKLLVFFLLLILLQPRAKGDGLIHAAKVMGIETKEIIKIIAATVTAGSLYGIVNDQITARICLEYFTKGFHRTMVDRWPIKSRAKALLLKYDTSPKIQGAVWGVLATAPHAAILGSTAAFASRIGSWPKLTAQDLAKPTASLLGLMEASSLIAGSIGYYRSAHNQISDQEKAFFARTSGYEVPEEKMAYYIADAYAHTAAYASASLGAIGLLSWIVYERLNARGES